MPITRTEYDVAFVDPATKDIVEHRIEVWSSDEMKAELLARRSGIKGSVVDSDTKVITDLGDVRNRQGLEVWAALTRLGLYDGKAEEFRREHCVGIEKVGEAQPVDPTQSEASTPSD